MRKAALFLAILLTFIFVSPYGEAAKQTFNANSIKYYQDIPGVTEEEIAAIEKLKSARSNFSYGHVYNTEAFILPDGTYAGFTTKFCRLLSDLFGIPFVQRFYDWENLKDSLDRLTLDFTGELAPAGEQTRHYYMTYPTAETWTRSVFDYTRKYANERVSYLSFFVVTLFLALVVGIFLFLHTKVLSLKLEKQTTTLSSIYHSIPDLVFCKDANYAYTSCNASFEDFAGRKESEIIGKNAAELFAYDKEMAGWFMETDKNVITKNTTRVTEGWFTYHDGRRKLMETIKTPLMQKGAVIGMLGISRDITEHVAAEEEAKAASVAKSVFLAHMSHEIRTPMNAIVGMAELILREDIAPNIYENAAGIKQASANLLSLINDILDFSKIEAGKLEIIPLEYSFVSLINDVLNIIRLKMKEKPLLLTTDIDCKIPARLIGDEMRFRQILMNILDNAVKYTDEGFVAITASGRIEGDAVLITIEVSDSGVGIKEADIGKLFLDFSRLDNVSSTKSAAGAGLGLAITQKLCRAMGGSISVRSQYGDGSTFTITMPQKFSVYEHFAKVEDPAQKQTLVYEPRFGYADSLAWSLANLGVRCAVVTAEAEFQAELRSNKYPFIFIASFLGESAAQAAGDLAADSRLILITEFGETTPAQNIETLTMPAHAAAIANILNDAAQTAKYNNGESGLSFVAPEARILIVDDIATNLKVAEGLMAPYKMRIDLCKSGAEAVRLAGKNRYDIIFMDHMMPEMDGVETTGKIRALASEDDYCQNVPIIALTANAISGMKEMFLQNGLDDFLAKPIEIIKLNDILEKWIPEEKREKYVAEKADSLPMPAGFEIGNLDVKAGIAMTGGTFENYLKTLAVFHQDGWEKMREISDCVAKEDLRLFTIHVHALKSGAASIGARQLSEMAQKLEKAGKSGALTFIRENTGELTAELKTVLNNIKAALQRSQSGGAASGDVEFLQGELIRLQDALANMDVGMINSIMSRLEAQTWDEKTGEAIGRISKHILLFEYDEAVEFIIQFSSSAS